MAIQSFPGKSQSTYQTSAPSNPRVGDIWLDSDSTSSSLNSNDYLLKNDGVKLFPSLTNNTITAFDASAVPLTLKGYLGQSVNLLNIITSASQNLLSIDNNANLTIGHSTATSTITQFGSSSWIGYNFRNNQSTASAGSGSYINNINENNINNQTIYLGNATDGSSYLNLYTTPAGSKTSDRRQASVIVEGAGYLRLPYQPMMYGSPTNTGGSGVTNSLGTTFLYNRGFSISSGRITVPVSGVYSITLNHICANSSVRRDSRILINGSTIAQALSEDATTGFHYRSIAIHKYLGANDYIEFYSDSWYNPTNINDEWRSCSAMLLG